MEAMTEVPSKFILKTKPTSIAFLHLFHAELQQGDTSMSSLIVEIRAAEGGDDAKMLVQTQLGIYTKVASRYRL